MNPRKASTFNGFQDRRIQPLCHSSAIALLGFIQATKRVYMLTLYFMQVLYAGVATFSLCYYASNIKTVSFCIAYLAYAMRSIIPLFAVHNTCATSHNATNLLHISITNTITKPNNHKKIFFILLPNCSTSLKELGMKKQPKAIALFSGGLDSILAATIIKEQGIDVECLHFCTPFFGKPHLIPHWEEIYGLKIRAVDIAEPYIDMLINRPKYGFGSCLNPCVDCKIMMIQKAYEIMQQEEACCIISGEVLGQRPMSQRRETLNIIRRDANVQQYLLRPLSAQLLDPTQAELDGIINRGKLLKVSGRGRKSQLELAEHYKLKEIPTPAGGCRLTEPENIRNYWAILQHIANPTPNDFYMANVGRQLWHFAPSPFWLTVGRNKDDNNAILTLAQKDDIIIKLNKVAGPIALIRPIDTPWPQELIEQAAAFTASYSTKAVKEAKAANGTTSVGLFQQNLETPIGNVDVVPEKTTGLFAEYSLLVTQADLKTEARERAR